MTIVGRENVKRTNPEAGSHRTLGHCGSKTGKRSGHSCWYSQDIADSEMGFALDCEYQQPVIKVCCCNGEKTYFKTIADAAKDCNISAPGLRERILRDVHANKYHWIFDKNSTHYK